MYDDDDDDDDDSFANSPDTVLQSELVMGHFFKTQRNPTHKSLHPTQPIIDTWYGILGYTENFIQQLLQIKISK